MSQKRSGQEGSDSLQSNLIIITITVVVMAVILWLIFGSRFSILMSILRKYELWLFKPFFAGALDLWQRLTGLNGSPLEFRDTFVMLTATGNYVRWLFIPPIVVMAVIVYMKSYRGRFRRRHSMSSLAKQEAVIWPEIAPVAGRQIEMVSGDITKGEWAAVMTEWEFAVKHKLAVRGGKLNRDASRDTFVNQLGPLWAGHQALPMHARALLAAFALRIAGKTDEALVAFRKMSSSYAAGGGLKGMDFTWVDAVLQEHGRHPNLLRVYERHAYTFTVMATVQQIARADGVLASPLYLWLKPVDRRLWYTLNNVGRYAFHVECAGIMSHWLFEKTVGAACPSPMVEKAIDGLEQALDDFTEDDSLDRLYT